MEEDEHSKIRILCPYLKADPSRVSLRIRASVYIIKYYKISNLRPAKKNSRAGPAERGAHSHQFPKEDSQSRSERLRNA